MALPQWQPTELLCKRVTCQSSKCKCHFCLGVISPPWLSKQSLPLIVADAYFLCLLVSALLERDWLSIVTLLVLKVLLFYALKFNINIMQIACSKKLIACQRVHWCSHSEHVNLNSLGKCNPLWIFSVVTEEWRCSGDRMINAATKLEQIDWVIRLYLYERASYIQTYYMPISMHQLGHLKLGEFTESGTSFINNNDTIVL